MLGTKTDELRCIHSFIHLFKKDGLETGMLMRPECCENENENEARGVRTRTRPVIQSSYANYHVGLYCAA